MFAGVIFVVSSSSELQSLPLSTHNILAPGTTLVLSSQRFHIHGEGPYQGLLMADNAYYLALSYLRIYQNIMLFMLNRGLNTVIIIRPSRSLLCDCKNFAKVR